MKVLLLCNITDRSELFLHREIINAGIKLDIICNPNAKAYDSFEEQGVEVTRIAMKSRIDFNGIRVIKEKILSNRYDIIHSVTNRTLSNALLASKGMPVKHIAYRGTIGHVSRWDPASWLTYLNPRVNRIVCVSEAVRRFLLSLKIQQERLITIYKGHDVKWYDNGRKKDLSEFGIPENAFVVGFAGDMRPVKGVDILLRSAFLIPKSKNIHFLLAGNIRDKRIHKLAQNPEIRNMVHIPGYRQDAAELMGACHVFIMPSIRREGLPRGVIEAMSQQVPAIVSNVGGMPELVVHEENGLIVPPKDPDKLAAGIMYFAEKPERCDTFGEKARARIKSHFNIETTVKQTLKLYEEAAGGKQRK
jgi:glycosyltransferase involved in cell wall biosynthesis